MPTRARNWIVAFTVVPWLACATPREPAAPERDAAPTTLPPSNPPDPAAKSAPPPEVPVPAIGERPSAPALPPPPALDLAPDWAVLDRASFERELVRATPLGEARELSSEQRATLARSLEGPRDTAVRAVLVLGRLASSDAAEILLAELERRSASTAIEVEELAARALASARPLRRRLPNGGSRELAPELAARLDALARGNNAHPRWSVRIECAASAVALGRAEAIPFLFGVLRWGCDVPSPPSASDLDEDRLAELQLRAAAVLSERAGSELAFQPYASVAARLSEIRRLETLIAQANRR